MIIHSLQFTDGIIESRCIVVARDNDWFDNDFEEDYDDDDADDFCE